MWHEIKEEIHHAPVVGVAIIWQALATSTSTSTSLPCNPAQIEN